MGTQKATKPKTPTKTEPKAGAPADVSAHRQSGVNTNLTPEVNVDVSTGMPIKPTGADNTGGDAGQTKTFTQEELNQIIADRLKRQEKAFEKKLNDALAKMQPQEPDAGTPDSADDAQAGEPGSGVDIDAIKAAVKAEMESEMDAKLKAALDAIKAEQRAEVQAANARTAIATTAQKMGLDAELVAKLVGPDAVQFDDDGNVKADALWQTLNQLAGKHSSLIIRPGLIGPDGVDGRSAKRTDDQRRREYFGGGVGDLFSGDGVIIS